MVVSSSPSGSSKGSPVKTLMTSLWSFDTVTPAIADRSEGFPHRAAPPQRRTKCRLSLCIFYSLFFFIIFSFFHSSFFFLHFFHFFFIFFIFHPSFFFNFSFFHFFIFFNFSILKFFVFFSFFHFRIFFIFFMFFFHFFTFSFSFFHFLHFFFFFSIIHFSSCSFILFHFFHSFHFSVFFFFSFFHFFEPRLTRETFLGYDPNSENDMARRFAPMVDLTQDDEHGHSQMPDMQRPASQNAASNNSALVRFSRAEVDLMRNVQSLQPIPSRNGVSPWQLQNPSTYLEGSPKALGPQETVQLVTQRAREALNVQRETARRALLHQQG